MCSSSSGREPACVDRLRLLEYGRLWRRYPQTSARRFEDHYLSKLAGTSSDVRLCVFWVYRCRLAGSCSRFTLQGRSVSHAMARKGFMFNTPQIRNLYEMISHDAAGFYDLSRKLEHLDVLFIDHAASWKEDASVVLTSAQERCCDLGLTNLALFIGRFRDRIQTQEDLNIEPHSKLGPLLEE